MRTALTINLSNVSRISSIHVPLPLLLFQYSIHRLVSVLLSRLGSTRSLVFQSPWFFSLIQRQLLGHFLDHRNKILLHGLEIVFSIPNTLELIFGQFRPQWNVSNNLRSLGKCNTARPLLLSHFDNGAFMIWPVRGHSSNYKLLRLGPRGRRRNVFAHGGKGIIPFPGATCAFHRRLVGTLCLHHFGFTILVTTPDRSNVVFVM
mmetsp:Transcript_1842/g.3318  ORF Transcript_1842/g.3318 Transcript_1842/m.3318 type:complete len:204 (-) Transcript_1842:53-664(-)